MAMEGKAVIQRVIDRLHGQQLAPLDEYVIQTGLAADHGRSDLPIKISTVNDQLTMLPMHLML